MLRWGTLFTFLFFFLNFIFAGIFRYNEILDAEILVTSENPPIDLFSRKSGRLVYKNFESGKNVHENEILAVIENSSNYQDIFYLKEKLQNDIVLFSTVEKLFQEFPSNLELETDIHSSYQSFLKAFEEYLLFLNLKEDSLTSDNLKSRILKLKKQLEIKQGRSVSASRNYWLSNEKYKRQLGLFKKGVISKQELDEFEQQLIVSKNDVSQIKEQIEVLKADTLSLKNLSQESLNKNYSNSSSLNSELQLTRQELKSKIEQWENIYTLKTPVSGKVTVFDIWKNHQNVNEGEHIITIVPESGNLLIGKCKVPVMNSAKLRLGQKVIIKLDNYPFHEWGHLWGTVNAISETPKKGEEVYYSVYVSIPDLTTSFGKEIEFRQEMLGQAKIILEEVSLLRRIFYGARNIWENIQQ